MGLLAVVVVAAVEPLAVVAELVAFAVVLEPAAAPLAVVPELAVSAVQRQVHTFAVDPAGSVLVPEPFVSAAVAAVLAGIGICCCFIFNGQGCFWRCWCWQWQRRRGKRHSQAVCPLVPGGLSPPGL